MECLFYPGVTPAMGMLSQTQQDLHWVYFVFIVAFFKTNDPLTEASLHTTFAIDSQCIGLQ